MTHVVGLEIMQPTWSYFSKVMYMSLVFPIGIYVLSPALLASKQSMSNATCNCHSLVRHKIRLPYNLPLDLHPSQCLFSWWRQCSLEEWNHIKDFYFCKTQYTAKSLCTLLNHKICHFLSSKHAFFHLESSWIKIIYTRMNLFLFLEIDNFEFWA